MTSTRMARIAGAALVAGAIATAAIVFETRRTDTPAEAPPPTAMQSDPLSAELARCRSMGLEAADDATCQTAWRAQRDRFFGKDEERR